MSIFCKMGTRQHCNEWLLSKHSLIKWSSRTSQHTLFNISQKKSHSTLRAKRATFTFWVDKSYEKCQKWSILASFWKPEACGQTVLPDRSVLIVQKLVENAKIKKSNATFWVIFKLCAFSQNITKLDWKCFSMQCNDFNSNSKIQNISISVLFTFLGIQL